MALPLKSTYIFILLILQALGGDEKEATWYIDSGCSLHMTGRLDFLREYKLCSNGGYITFGNDTNGIIRGHDILTNGNFLIQ